MMNNIINNNIIDNNVNSNIVNVSSIADDNNNDLVKLNNNNNSNIERKNEKFSISKEIIKADPDIALNNNNINSFWNHLNYEIQSIDPATEDFHNHQMISKDILKSFINSDNKTDDMTMSKDCELALSRLSELFICDISFRSYQSKIDKSDLQLQVEDIKNALLKTDIYDFLIDIAN